MKSFVNWIVVVFLYVFCDTESDSFVQNTLMPVLLAISLGVLIFRFYRRRGHDDSTSYLG